MLHFAHTSAHFQWRLSYFPVIELNFKLPARFSRHLKSEERKIVTRFFNLLNTPLHVTQCKYGLSPGAISLQQPYQKVTCDAKQAALGSGKGRWRLYTLSWLIYIWQQGGGFVIRVLSWDAGELLGPLWGNCCTTLYVTRGSLRAKSHQMINW